MENKLISISLTVNEWNMVVNALAARPFAEVSKIISEMQSQASSQIESKKDVSES